MFISAIHSEGLNTLMSIKIDAINEIVNDL
jgi:hypothetical protein